MQRAVTDDCFTMFQHLSCVSLCIIRLLFKGEDMTMVGEVLPQSAGKKKMVFPFKNLLVRFRRNNYNLGCKMGNTV